METKKVSGKSASNHRWYVVIKKEMGPGDGDTDMAFSVTIYRRWRVNFDVREVLTRRHGLMALSHPQEGNAIPLTPSEGDWNLRD